MRSEGSLGSGVLVSACYYYTWRPLGHILQPWKQLSWSCHVHSIDLLWPLEKMCCIHTSFWEWSPHCANSWAGLEAVSNSSSWPRPDLCQRPWQIATQHLEDELQPLYTGSVCFHSTSVTFLSSLPLCETMNPQLREINICVRLDQGWDERMTET